MQLLRMRRKALRVVRSFTASLRALGMELSSDPILPPLGGIPLFIALTTKLIFGFHPWRAMKEHYIQTTSAVMTGGKGSGKTAAALLLMYYTAQLDMGNGRRVRIIYDNMRTDDGNVAEDEELLKAFGDKGVRISVRNAKVNPYDYRLRLSPSQMLRWTLATVFDLNKLTFDEFEISILGQLIRKMLSESKEQACPTLLVQMAEEFEVEDYTRSILTRRRHLIKLVGNNREGLALLDRVLKPEVGLEKRLAISNHPELITKAAASLAAKLNTTLLETAEEIYGDTNSLAEMMGDYLYVSQDLTGVEDALASSYHYLARLYIRNKGMFDIIAQDETSKSWRFASWAAAESDDEWQIREFNPFKIRIIQELDLLKMSADADTQQYQMALNSVNGAGAHFIFGGQSESAYRGLAETLQLSELDVLWLSGISDRNPGTFGLKPRDGSLVRAQVLVTTPFDVRLIASNSSMARRLGRMSRHELRRARQNEGTVA